MQVDMTVRVALFPDETTFLHVNGAYKKHITAVTTNTSLRTADVFRRERSDDRK